MATLEEIEKSYYKAIQATTLSEANDYATDVTPLYPKDAFRQWARKVDIYDLEKHKADFSLDEEIVKAFGQYRRDVATQFGKYFEFDDIQLKGQIRNIGSCHDGSKVGRMNEADSLYILDTDNILVEETHSHGIYRIFWTSDSATKCEILPRSIRHQFADAFCNVVSGLTLPECLRHGGYKSPDYGGLRYNGPAATAQFLTENNSLLTWDMTPTFCLPHDHHIHDEVRKLMQPIIQQNKDKMVDTIDLHLVPDTALNLWRLSTAQMEADILRIMSSVAPFKQALSYCKVLSAKLKKWTTAHGRHQTLGEHSKVNIVKELDEYLKDSFQRKEVGERLNLALRYAHVWIPPEKRGMYNEDQKAYVSINTAAVKHILLSAALEQPEAFSPKENTELVIDLMKKVFHSLGDPTRFSSPHAFLSGCNISHVSVLASQAAKKVPMALNAKEQCGVLLEKAMTTVSE